VNQPGWNSIPAMDEINVPIEKQWLSVAAIAV
jgi:hypothetical protein